MFFLEILKSFEIFLFLFLSLLLFLHVSPQAPHDKEWPFCLTTHQQIPPRAGVINDHIVSSISLSGLNIYTIMH